MNENTKVIEGLQAIVTGLSQQADGHEIQSRIFFAQGLDKLGKKYAEHVSEERGYVEKCIDRLLDLGAGLKNEAKPSAPVYTNPIDWIKYDLEVSKNGLAWLKEIISEAKDDLTTYDILKEYYKDEEEDMYWAEQQLELIERIGEKNWLSVQL